MATETPVSAEKCCDAHDLLAQQLRAKGEHDAAEAIEAAAQVIAMLGTENARLRALCVEHGLTEALPQ